LLDGLLSFIELFAVAAGEHDSGVLGKLECREATYAGGRAGDDVCRALGGVVSESGRLHIKLLSSLSSQSFLELKKLTQHSP
jgi:hypothetical protein